MSEFGEIDRMIEFVTSEQKEWKAMMDDLASIFYNRFPAKRKYGWTLHVRRCAEKKQCTMCPHSITWVRYYYVKLEEETKKKLRSEGKTAPKYKISWDNSEKGKSKTGLPGDIKAGPKVRAIFQDFEEVRAVIMEQHRALTKLRKGLMAKKRTAMRKAEETGLSLRSYFDSGVLRAFHDMLVPYRPTREEVARKLNEMRKKYFTPRI